jgi:hypothetical protein
MSKTGLAVLALTLLAGCNRDHKKVIAVIPKGSAHLLCQSVHAGAAKAALEKGVSIVWNGPATETDYSSQLQIVDAMITKWTPSLRPLTARSWSQWTARPIATFHDISIRASKPIASSPR